MSYTCVPEMCTAWFFVRLYHHGALEGGGGSQLWHVDLRKWASPFHAIFQNGPKSQIHFKGPVIKYGKGGGGLKNWKITVRNL